MLPLNPAKKFKNDKKPLLISISKNFDIDNNVCLKIMFLNREVAIILALLRIVKPHSWTATLII